MAAIRRGFPVDADPRVLAVVAIAERDRLVPLLTVRAPRCGCIVGVVHRANEITVLTGTAVVKVLTAVVKSQDHWQTHRQRYAVLLSDPDRPVTLACRHGGTAAGELASESLNRIRAAVAAATHRGQDMYLSSVQWR